MDEKKIVDLAEVIKSREHQAQERTPKAKLVHLLEIAELAIAVAMLEENSIPAVSPASASLLRDAQSWIQEAINIAQEL